ncbi:MAG: hypothetical protein ACREHF_11595 [Rhizomicrobium sp.]
MLHCCKRSCKAAQPPATPGSANGGYPYGTLALDSASQIFGTTQYSGSYDVGEMYELKR